MLRSTDGLVILSPTDLANHLACRHLTTLSHDLAAGQIRPPKGFDPRAEVLAERGRRHEEEYLDFLRQEGLQVEVVPTASTEATLELMRQGVDVLAQATLGNDRWQGRADVLLRVHASSELGTWSYEVVDTKLGRKTKATTILQLCAYSVLLEDLQGLRPRELHVVPPGCGFQRESYALDDYGAYFRRVREYLEAEIGSEFRRSATYPHPTDHCDICRWWLDCQGRRRQDDHLCLVAGMTRLHETELREWGVETRAELAALPLPLERRSKRGSLAVFERLREQARIQVESAGEDPPLYERLPVQEGQGLARLPKPSAGDVFLDFEGDRFVGEAGLEYLVGWIDLGEERSPEYHCSWATTPQEERAAFERLVDELMERWNRHPDFHVYHFTPYEPGAMKRLMGRYATREDEVDRLLRGGRFVDLHGVVRQGLRVGVESYSLKNLEPLYDYRRDQELREASRTLLRVELALEMNGPEQIPQEDRETVERYNRDDCLSTLHLRGWLESVREEAIQEGEEVQRPEPKDEEPSEKLTEWQRQIRLVQEQLHAGLPDDPALHDEEQRARWILGHVLEFHQREAKVEWWDFFRLAEMSEDERYDEPKAIAGMEHERRIPQYGKTGRKTLPIDRYRFPPQEVDERHDDARTEGDVKLGKVVDVNGAEGWVEIKKSGAGRNLHPSSIFKFSRVTDQVLRDSLLRLAESVAEHGLEGNGPYRPARELLLRRKPRLQSERQGPLRREGESPSEGARRLALELDGGILPIQGPPGSGKTYTGARMILDLVRAGKKVGITALSHKVIRNLLDKTVEAAAQEDYPGLRCIQKISSEDEPADETVSIEETHDNARVLAALQSGEVAVAGGTAWLWAREDMADSVDVLFIDEAAQLSLATTLAAAQAARNLVLIGDPQQLEQPIQGTHPGETGTTALEHLLGDAETMPEDRGLFLEETFRLHPEICSFTSKLYYEGRLQSRRENSNQVFHGPTPFDGPGLYWIPVEHDANQSRSEEEANVVEHLVRHWLDRGAEWTDREGIRRPLTWDDILIVVPYNAQVACLKDCLPNARIGTVDKFQGQEAPVVVYAMTTSSPEEAPHGMEFLYSRHRLNVATSRARCAVVLIASPRLLEPECRTPRQMLLVNGLCEFVERAHEVTTAHLGFGSA